VSYYNTTDEQRSVGSHKVLLLEKPVRAIAGGAEHHGVGVFPLDPSVALTDDPEWSVLAGWVAGHGQPKPVSSDCQNTFDNLGLTPR
jgi:hypothetical protein